MKPARKAASHGRTAGKIYLCLVIPKNRLLPDETLDRRSMTVARLMRS